MFPLSKYKPILAAVAVLVILLVGVLPALAAAPANDDISSATVIASLPFSVGLYTNEATSDTGDPSPSCNYYGIREATVWYQYSPVYTQYVTASTSGSSYTTNLGVYTGGPGLLSEVACAIDYNPVYFLAEAGNTYYIMVAAVNGSPYPSPSPGPFGGWLNFSLTPAPLPEVYFDYWSDPSYGLRSIYFNNQSYDPTCTWCGLMAWWDFGDGTTSTDWSPSHQFPSDGQYLVSLTVTTYDGRSATTQRQVEVTTPPPVADFWPNPYDPSTYDSVYFSNWSYDPACYYCGMTAQWDFGDGTSSNEWSPSHHYAADGDYTVKLVVTTSDGRSASTSRLLQVRTIDIAIYRFSVPQSAKSGQTRSISVEVNNTTYPVQVEVQLYKSTIWGWQWVGSLQQYVPVRPSNRTTRFGFNYTFTMEDAQIGKVNFRAVAYVVEGRDALPMNNEVISLPTKVSR